MIQIWTCVNICKFTREVFAIYTKYGSTLWTRSGWIVSTSCVCSVSSQYNHNSYEQSNLTVFTRCCRIELLWFRFFWSRSHRPKEPLLEPIPPLLESGEPAPMYVHPNFYIGLNFYLYKLDKKLLLISQYFKALTEPHHLIFVGY